MEHLNAEIVQLTVSDVSLAIEWLKCSYLFVRIKKVRSTWSILYVLSSQLFDTFSHMLPESRILWH